MAVILDEMKITHSMIDPQNQLLIIVVGVKVVPAQHLRSTVLKLKKKQLLVILLQNS